MSRPNRLAAEKSPYLLQHARNPVDWHPWGEQAFERARREDRPIFLSIGYATCHWCHVMERESFEDPTVAALLNEAFVCVKVDREERPDVDGVYMAAAQVMGGRGGWPLNLLLTPALEPFYAATYLPRASRPGVLGMLDLVPRVREVWSSRRADIDRSAAEITEALAGALDPPAAQPLDFELLRSRTVEHFTAIHDAEHGGFGGAPKFPSPHNLVFLLKASPAAAALADHTLRRMRLGGIWDHVGFGFHRYSTDAEWLLPHFEKMLYDQALLALACLEAAAATGRDEHARTARECLAYVMRDLRLPEGAFACAEDADSECEEGRFYLWTADEIRQTLGSDAEAVMADMNVRPEGNFRDERSGLRTGANILHRSAEPAAASLDAAAWERCRLRLLAARERRPRPLRDDKVLADLNGLAIAALARAGRALGEPGFVAAAQSAAAFVLGRMRTGDGRLLHRYRDGEAAIAGLLDDYAFLLWGMIELHQATLESRWLAEAVGLADTMLAEFRDEAAGGLFAAPRSAAPLLVRRKESFDHATPSGNSVAAHELLRLSRLTGSPDYEREARAILEAFSGSLAEHPAYHTHMLQALALAAEQPVEVVIVAERPAEAARDLPLGVLVLGKSASGDEELERLAPFTRAMQAIDGRPTWHVCRAFACALPTTDRERAVEMIRAGQGGQRPPVIVSGSRRRSSSSTGSTFSSRAISRTVRRSRKAR